MLMMVSSGLTRYEAQKAQKQLPYAKKRSARRISFALADDIGWCEQFNYGYEPQLVFNCYCCDVG